MCIEPQIGAHTSSTIMFRNVKSTNVALWLDIIQI